MTLSVDAKSLLEVLLQNPVVTTILLRDDSVDASALRWCTSAKPVSVESDDRVFTETQYGFRDLGSIAEIMDGIKLGRIMRCNLNLDREIWNEELRVRLPNRDLGRSKVYVVYICDVSEGRLHATYVSDTIVYSTSRSERGGLEVSKRWEHLVSPG